jgi:hypothetical protein
MTSKLRAPIIEGVLWLAFAGAAFALSTQFDGPVIDFKYTAATWPRAIIFVIGCCAFVQMVTIIVRYRQTAKMALMESSSERAEHTLAIHLKRIATFSVPLIYLFLLPRTGYYITTPFFLAGYMVLLGEQRWTRVVVTALSIYIFTLIFFTILLFVPLPIGNWPGFYHISSAFIALVK